MKGVFNIMKTNKGKKLIIALLAVVILASLTAAVNAETGSGNTTKAAEPQRSDKGYRNQPRKQDGEWFEDWFEHRIESREKDVDFSQLPDKPSEKEMLEFFQKNFTGGNASDNNNVKPSQPMKKDRKADRFDDWFEDRIESREHSVDFSELPENPTDEEILDFFKKYFMTGSTEEDVKGQNFENAGKPFREQKCAPEKPLEPEKTPDPKPESLPETIENTPSEEKPSEEGDRDKA